MIKKYYSNVDVVTTARQRIKNIFRTAPKVYLSVSGGKDSIVLNDLIFKMCQNGTIDKSKLQVVFIDEEAIYPCVEKIVKNMRLAWLSLGVEFIWWCIECRHYNCFNQLTNDESFICWDRFQKDVWVRQMPPFAKTSHPLFKPRQDSYQQFLTRYTKDGVSLIGVRVNESMQRANALANRTDPLVMYPIYDFTDKDIWRYIRDNNLDIPNAYLYLYQCGRGKNKMRLSQFFSVDTAKDLVNMCEYYPDLFNKICKREPNAYIAMLYYDTELFRRTKERKSNSEEDNIDYKAKVLERLYDDKFFETKSAKETQRNYSNIIIKFGPMLTRKHYKKIYTALIGGDPKGRAFRALFAEVGKNIRNEV